MTAAAQLRPAFDAKQHDQKRWSDFRARAALASYCLYRSAPEDGDVTYFVQRWGMVRGLADLDAVERWLRQVGA